MPADSVAELLACDRGHDVLERIAAIVADEIERGVGVRSRHLRERADQIEDVPAIEDRADVEQTSRSRRRVCCRASVWNARRNDVNAPHVDAQMFGDLLARELRDGDDL